MAKNLTYSWIIYFFGKDEDYENRLSPYFLARKISFETFQAKFAVFDESLSAFIS